MPSSPNSILKAIRQLIANNTLGGAAELAILIGSSIQHGKDVITKVLDGEQVEKYNQILDSQNKDEAENFLTSFMSENGFNSTERMLARIKAREKSVIAFNEQQKIVEAKKKAEAKAKRESKVSIKSLADDILAKPYLFNQKEISFLNDIKTKRKLTEKQVSWLESLANKANVQIKGEFDLRLARSQTSNISFEDYVEDFLDMSLGLMSQREKAEAYEAYQSMLKENRFDSAINNDPKEIIAAIRTSLTTPSEDNIQALAEVAGLVIKPVLTNGFVKKGASRYEYIIWGVPKDGSLEELLFTQNQQGEVIATIEKAKDIKALLEDKYGVTKARIQEVDLGGGFDFSKEIAQPQADEKAAKDKAIADKQVGDFRLSGSSMPSDVAASYGQNDMFVQTRGEPKDDNELLIAKLERDLILLDNNTATAKSYNKINEAIEKIKLTRFLIDFIKNDFYLSYSDYLNSIIGHKAITIITPKERLKFQNAKTNQESQENYEYVFKKLLRYYERELKKLKLKKNSHFDDIGNFTFDSIANNNPKEILAAIRKLIANNTPENAQALADLAGLSIEKPSPSDDLIPNFLKPFSPSTKSERAIESPEVEELAAFYAKELGRGSVNAFHVNFAKAVLSKDVYSLEHLANGSNDVAKSVFTKATGVKLPKQQGQTWKALLEWAGVSQESDNLKKARSNVKYEYERAKREYNLSDKTLEDFKESTLLKIADGYDKIINANKKYWLVNSSGQGYSLSEKGKKGVVGMSNLRNLIAALIEEYKASQLINAAKESTFSTDKEVKALAVNDEPKLQTKTITVKVPVSASTLATYTAGAWGNLSLLSEKDFLKTWQYVNAANYMLRNSIDTTDSKTGNRHILGQSGKPELVKLVNDEFTKRGLDQKYSLFVERKNNRFDDIGGFNFEPMVSVDATMQAIKKLIAENTLDNARYLAMIAGLTLKQAEPDIELDMFGDPIQSQGFDLFGDPIQDGEESPVEELPRLAVVELPLNKLTLSDDVPQFKSGADDESGVVEALGGKFDRTGVAPIQVWERKDGRLEIISGRHRTDLARRSGEKTIPAQVHKESEGFTAKQAMMLDAELNIRDGQGKVKDYVDYFTHSEISEDEADRRGLIARSIGQRAFTIASKGSEELKTLHRNDIISDQAAAEIASIAPNNSAMQAVGLRVLQEYKPLNNALNTIRAVMALTREKGQEPDTFDLFGFDDSALKEAEAMARIASRKQRQIAEQLNAIKGAVKNPKLAAKHGVVVENEADALAKVQAMTAQKARWDNWSSHADLLAEVREELNAKFDSFLDDEDDYYWLCQEELV